MAREIERKFLVDKDVWRPDGPGRRFRQGYLMVAEDRSLRVRHEPGHGAWMTFKAGKGTFDRSEFDYQIPETDAEDLLAHCDRRMVEKVRYTAEVGRHVYEIDVFEGQHAGLVVAEIELSTPGEAFERPDWLGAEVTGDRRYLNASLALSAAED